MIHDLNGITAIKFLERHFAPTRTAVMQKYGHVTSIGEDVEKPEASYTATGSEK